MVKYALGISLFFIQVLFAQNPELGSLRKALEQPENHHAYIRTCLKVAKAFGEAYPDSNARYIELAKAELQESDSAVLRYEVFQKLGELRYRQKNMKAMYAAAQSAEAIALTIPDRWYLARAYRQKALGMPVIPRDSAISYIEKAIDLLRDQSPKEQKLLADCYRVYAFLLQYQAPERAQNFRLKALTISEALNDTAHMARSYIGIGMYYRNVDIDSALYFFRRAEQFYASQQKFYSYASISNKIATCYQVKEITDSVLRYSKQAIELGKRSGNIDAIRQGLKLLLRESNEKGDYESALQYGNELLEIEGKHPSGYLSLIWIDFATVYQEMKEIDSTRVYLKKAIAQAKLDRYPPGLANSTGMLGELEMREGNYAIARTYVQETDDMYVRMKFDAARFRSIQRLAEIDFLTQNYAGAKNQYSSLLDLAKRLQNISAQAIAHRGLARCDSAKGNFSSAFNHAFSFAQLQDSFNQQSFTKEVATLQTQFKTEQQRANIQNLEQQQVITKLELAQTSSQRNSLLLIVGILAIAAALIGFLFFRLRKNKQRIESQAEELQLLNQTKDRLFGIIAHDLRGPVTNFQTLGKIFQHHIQKGNTDMLLNLSERVEQQGQQVKMLLDNLLHWSLQQLGIYRPQWEHQLLEPLGKEIIAFHEESSIAKGNEIELDIPSDLAFSLDQNGMRVILHNLLANAVKFTDKGTITVSASKKQDAVTIEVNDTGKGMSEKQLTDFSQQGSLPSERGTAGERGTGLGLNVVKQLIEHWGGKVNIESKPFHGTRVQLLLPLR